MRKITVVECVNSRIKNYTQLFKQLRLEVESIGKKNKILKLRNF